MVSEHPGDTGSPESRKKNKLNGMNSPSNKSSSPTRSQLEASESTKKRSIAFRPIRNTPSISGSRLSHH